MGVTMPAINFKRKFTAPVASGKKRQTIRKRRKRPILKGDTLYLYSGMRTKQVLKLRDAKCIAVLPIVITKSLVTLDSKVLNIGEIDRLAKLDGFTTTEAFFQFFSDNYDFPFTGEVIKW